MIRTRLLRAARPLVASRPIVKKLLLEADASAKLLRHTFATVAPALIRPVPEQLTVAITAKCNLRCIGCRYGRDFMPNAELPLQIARDLLTDAASAGFPTVRLYGGEPLLHRDLPAIIEHALHEGIKPYVTTNGILLQRRMAELYDAGLRTLTIGFYGVADAYDVYVARGGAFCSTRAICRERSGRVRHDRRSADQLPADQADLLNPTASEGVGVCSTRIVFH